MRRAGHHPGRALAARPASNFELHTHHYGDDYNTKPKNQKTYGRFFGMIFFGGFRPTLMAGPQRLAKSKSIKKWKIAKKSFIFFARTPRFSSKTAKKRPVFSVNT
jgi:hypothetical protein